MALKATVLKTELQIADMDRHYYQSHSLTIAQHPSETSERLMIRVLAFALHAHERLEFTRGLSADDEPELWQKDYSDQIEYWIELGQPDERRVRKACNRAQHVIVISYGGNVAQTWWKKSAADLQRFSNLTVLYIAREQAAALEALYSRSMSLQATIQDGQVWLSNPTHTVHITPERWQSARD